MKFSHSFVKQSSKILLGTAYFGDTITPDESFKIMDTFFENGGNHIDTARLYADGEAERVIGEWIKLRRPDTLFISTKGAFPDKATPDVSRLSEQEIRSDLEKSLEALGLDCVDFYWLHRDDESLEVAPMINTLNSLVKEGKIKRFGASNWHTYRISEANAYAKSHGLMGFEASQMRFSPAVIAPGGTADRTLVDMTKEDFAFYKEAHMPVCAYASQAKGFFSKMAQSGVAALSEKSRGRYLCDENIRRLELVRNISEKYGISVAAAVCASLASITVPDVFPIIGGSRAKQIVDSMSGIDVTLSESELSELFGYEL